MYRNVGHSSFCVFYGIILYDCGIRITKVQKSWLKYHIFECLFFKSATNKKPFESYDDVALSSNIRFVTTIASCTWRFDNSIEFAIKFTFVHQMCTLKWLWFTACLRFWSNCAIILSQTLNWKFNVNAIWKVFQMQSRIHVESMKLKTNNAIVSIQTKLN